MNDQPQMQAQTKEQSKGDRMRDAAAACIAALNAWENNTGNEELRERLMETVHDMRKVLARIEVDIALHERNATNSRRIPIPEHKSKSENRRDQKPLSEILPVAEIKRANEARKIAIEAASRDEDDAHTYADGDDEQAQDNTGAQPAKRRGRRKKREDGASE